MTKKSFNMSAERPSVAKDAKRAASEGPKMRLTIEIPANLHGRIKGSCALRNVKMVEELTALLEEKYPPA